ncbi:hypothetical protein GS429_14935 [Natronorubrum sp. JWXQ-INN-674]|uniref:DUF7350 domain-containing protein n=1 Tax=Natronorubrum halalkaliphilum TaxID=2691917 RepID=A0A6B0VQH3_9EURY|nr:hypothetical protein [Natronorubrum halalkaliphilum]MXV63337.1 hypothetical protein [Natronorubrum halalkaliphilum]
MNRRGFLRGTAVAGTVGVAGCLERLGFEEQSAWSNPPIVENRPDAVYLPAGIEEMGTYGRATDGEYAVELSYTIPHRFWIIAGETEQVDVAPDDSLHLMLTVWDVDTDTVLPVNLSLEILRDGDSVGGRLTPWSMLSQRMGFHYGDNIQLPEEGVYTARVQVGPVDAARTGAFADRLAEAATLEIEFEFERSDIHDLEFELIDDDRRGDREALPLMDHGDHGGEGHGEDGHGDGDGDHDGSDHDGADHDRDPGHPPPSVGPPVNELPGELFGPERSGDAKVSVNAVRTDRFTDDPAYLAVSVRTPYHDISLPSASLNVTVERDGTPVLEREPLTETLDHEFGHHYGIGTDGLERGDEITVAVDSPPQVSRHDGYETAFFEFEPVTYTV